MSGIKWKDYNPDYSSMHQELRKNFVKTRLEDQPCDIDPSAYSYCPNFIKENIQKICSKQMSMQEVYEHSFCKRLGNPFSVECTPTSKDSFTATISPNWVNEGGKVCLPDAETISGNYLPDTSYVVPVLIAVTFVAGIALLAYACCAQDKKKA